MRIAIGGRGPKLVALCVTLALSAVPAAVADPPAFVAASGTCTTSQNTGRSVLQPFPSQSQDHPAVLERFAATNGAGTLFANEDTNRDPFGGYENGYVDFASGDTLWLLRAPIKAGSPIKGIVHCDSAAAWDAALFDVPSTPVSFSGAGRRSRIAAVARGAGIYEATITVSGGGVSVTAPSTPAQQFVSTGKVQFLISKPGAFPVTVDPLDGPPPAWTLDLRAVPVVLSAVSFSLPAARPRARNQLAYTTSADSSVTIKLQDSQRRVVRYLAQGLDVGLGKHSVTWDGLTAAGEPVADGAYAAIIDAVDASGNATEARRSVVVDWHPPTIKVLSRRLLGAHQGVRVRLLDRASGIQSATLSIGARSHRLAPRARTITLGPGAGSRWRPGGHKFVVLAKDRAGNSIRRVGQFRVR